MSEHALPRPQHEENDAGFRFVLYLLGCIGVTLVLMAGLAWWIFPAALTDKSMHGIPHFPAPTLQPNPRRDMEVFYREEMRHLRNAGWIDRGKGIVHIPIDQAMRKVAEEGIAGWPAPPVGAQR